MLVLFRADQGKLVRSPPIDCVTRFSVSEPGRTGFLLICLEQAAQKPSDRTDRAESRYIGVVFASLIVHAGQNDTGHTAFRDALVFHKQRKKDAVVRKSWSAKRGLPLKVGIIDGHHVVIGFLRISAENAREFCV